MPRLTTKTGICWVQTLRAQNNCHIDVNVFEREVVKLGIAEPTMQHERAEGAKPTGFDYIVISLDREQLEELIGVLEGCSEELTARAEEEAQESRTK